MPYLSLLMKRWSKPFIHVLLAGTCIGLFLYLRSLPVIRFLSETGADSQMLWSDPSLERLGVYLFSANVALFVVWFTYSGGYANFFNLSLKIVLQRDASTYLPFCILGIALMQFNTFLISHSDVFLLLSHNLGYFVFLAAILGMVYLKTENHRDLQRVGLHSTSAIPGSLPQLTWKRVFAIFLLSLLIYGVVGKQIIARLPLGGDEPHYLLISHSLLHDHDLAIKNNYNQHDYRAFYSGELQRHVSIGKDGSRYSIHSPGVALLLLPGYALGGRAGAVLMMNLMAALLAAVLYMIAFAQTRHPWLALIIWGIASFTTPLLLYSSQLYPEIPSALLLGMAYYLIRFQRSFTRIAAMCLGLCLLYLPWLQQRMILPTILLTGYYLYMMGLFPWQHGWKNKLSGRALLPLLFVVLSGVFMAGYYYLLYGNPLPNAPYLSVIKDPIFSWAIFWREGLLGLLFDQEAGLFIFSPYYIFLIPGFLLFFRRYAAHALILFTLILSIYIPCAGFILQWRGAWSPASRYMVTLIPLFIVPLSISLHALRRPAYRYMFAFLTAIGLFWTGLFLIDPFSSLMARGGINTTFEQNSNLVDLTRYFPSFSATSTNAMLLTGIWSLVILGFSLFAYRSARSSSFGRLFAPPIQRVKYVFACYGVVIGILAALSPIAAHTRNDAFSKWAKNKQILNFLSHFKYETIFTAGAYQEQPFSDSQFRLEYMSRERIGKVDDQRGPRFLIAGPRQAFPPGTYTTYFSFIVNPCPDDTPVVTLDIVADRGKKIFARYTFFGKDFPLKEEEEQVSLRFTLPPGIKNLETRVYFHNQVRILLKNIAIEPNLQDFYDRKKVF